MKKAMIVLGIIFALILLFVKMSRIKAKIIPNTIIAFFITGYLAL